MSWPLIQLNKLVTANYGKALKKEHRIESGKVNVFGSSGIIGFHNEAICKYPTLVIGRKGSVGEITWAPTGGWVIDTAYYLEILDNNRLDLRYLFHNLKQANLAQKTITTSIPGLNRDDLYSTEIPLPPLAEQKRIAAILDKADAIRRKRQQAIELADEFLRSVFLDMFGDPVTNPKDFPVGTIRDLVDSVNYGTSSKASEIDGEYPILRMGNITYNGDWDFTSLKYIDLAEKEKAKYLVSKGDLLFNRTNSKELVGKTAVYEEDKPMAIAGYLIRVRPNSDGNNHYISGYLNSMHGKETLMAMCKNIVGMANINAQELQDIKILIPPKKYQDQYANIVIATKSKVKKLKQALAEADILFKALSQRAFAGEL